MLHLVQVAESFEDEAVYAAFHEPIDLPLVELLSFLTGGGSERLDPDAQGPDGPDHQGPTLGRPSGKAHGGVVDFLRSVGQAIAGELHWIGTKGVGLDDFGAGVHIVPVDGLYDIRRFEVESVVRNVDENPTGVEFRSHRTVHDVNAPVVDEFLQGVRSLRFLRVHGAPSSGSYPRLD